MKKFLFVATIVLTIIAIWFVLACLLVRIFGDHGNFWHTLGSWSGQPYVILFSVGIGLLFRNKYSSLFFETEKSYSNKVAYYLIGFALLWGGWMFGLRLYQEHQMKELMEIYEQRYRP